MKLTTICLLTALVSAAPDATCDDNTPCDGTEVCAGVVSNASGDYVTQLNGLGLQGNCLELTNEQADGAACDGAIADIAELNAGKSFCTVGSHKCDTLVCTALPVSDGSVNCDAGGNCADAQNHTSICGLDDGSGVWSVVTDQTGSCYEQLVLGDTCSDPSVSSLCSPDLNLACINGKCQEKLAPGECNEEFPCSGTDETCVMLMTGTAGQMFSAVAGTRVGKCLDESVGMTSGGVCDNTAYANVTEANAAGADTFCKLPLWCETSSNTCKDLPADDGTVNCTPDGWCANGGICGTDDGDQTYTSISDDSGLCWSSIHTNGDCSVTTGFCDARWGLVCEFDKCVLNRPGTGVTGERCLEDAVCTASDATCKVFSDNTGIYKGDSVGNGYCMTGGVPGLGERCGFDTWCESAEAFCDFRIGRCGERGFIGTPCKSDGTCAYGYCIDRAEHEIKGGGLWCESQKSSSVALFAPTIAIAAALLF